MVKTIAKLQSYKPPSKEKVNMYEKRRIETAKPKRKVREKDFMKFDFFFKRTCFRTMTLYYKTIFKPYFSQCKNLKNNESVLEVVRDFAQEYQPNLMALLDKLGG